MKKNLIWIAIAASITACVPSNPKEKINKGGEVVGEAVGEFVSGMGNGVEKSVDPKVELPTTLKEKGIQLGDIQVSSQGGTDNTLSIYLIFDKDFNGEITIKAYNEQDKEMGRVRDSIVGKKGHAGFHDFVFDKRTNIDNNSKLVFE